MWGLARWQAGSIHNLEFTQLINSYPQHMLGFPPPFIMQIASKSMKGLDIDNITISVMALLQQFSWETKVALVVATYTLTFGDYGFNLCSESKVSLTDLPFLKNLLQATTCVVEFDKLNTTVMTFGDQEVRTERTRFIVAAYCIIRATVVNATHHIRTMPVGRKNRSQSKLHFF